MKNHLQKSAGFTLVEVMLVIALIGILAVVTIPKYNGVKAQFALEEAAQQIMDEMDYARQLARDQRILTYVVLNETGVYVLQGGYDSDRTLKRPSLGEEKTFPAGIRLRLPDDPELMEIKDDSTDYGRGLSYNYQGFVRLYEEGSTLSEGEIELIHTNGRTAVLKISRTTGKTELIWP